MTIPSRPWRVGGILALLAWSLSAVPDRVQAQREAVARIASERGAASAGGALLGVLDDLQRYGGTMGDEAWWIDRTLPLPALAVSPTATWDDRIQAVRRLRAARAVQEVPADAEGAVLVDVEGDLYLVLAQAARAPLDVARGPSPDPALTPVEGLGLDGAAAALPDGADREVETRLVLTPDGARVERRAGTRVTVDDRGDIVVRAELDEDVAADLADARRDLREAGRDVARHLRDDPLVTVQIDDRPDDAAQGLRDARDALRDARDALRDARDAARFADDEARDARDALRDARDAARFAADEARDAARSAADEARDAARSAEDEARDAARSAEDAAARPAVRLRTPELRIPAIDVADLHLPELLLPPFDLVVDVAGAGGPGAFGAVPVTPGDTALVAWWPPVQARVEALSGVPLQVDGAPPRARSILPAYRLSGLPVWSLPTPEAEAAFDLFDGGSVLWLLLLGGLLAREYVTWRREDAQERERQVARDGILQRLSHELRTPAASVRTLVDALDHPGTSDAERAEFLLLVRSEAERLANGIDRLLQAARGDATLTVEPIPLDLAEWAHGVQQRWITRLPGLRVEGLAPCPVVADPERLDEAIDALLDNARKYGGPTVTLTLARDRIVVDDDGPGVPAADRARVLQKFERVEGRVNDPGGHGLGLWAAGEVARAHGGRLTLEGPARFVITLGDRR